MSYNIVCTNPTGSLQLSPSDTIFSQISVCEEVISSQSFPISAAPSYVSICRLQEGVRRLVPSTRLLHRAGLYEEPGKLTVNHPDRSATCSFFGHYICSWMARREVRTAGQRVMGLFSSIQEKRFAALCSVCSSLPVQISMKLIASFTFNSSHI